MPGRDFARVSGAVSVLVTDTLVLATNPSRMEFTVVNDSANIIYLQLQKAPTVAGQATTSTAAVASQGIRLNASGGTYTTQTFKGEVRAIALTGTSVLTVVE